MVKFQLKYGIQASLVVTSADDRKPVTFTLKHPEAEVFMPRLRRELENTSVLDGHLFSIDSCSIPDLFVAMRKLQKSWRATLIEGEIISPMTSSQLPRGSIS